MANDFPGDTAGASLKHSALQQKAETGSNAPLRIRPIRNEADYEAALSEIACYFAHEPAPGTEDADRFDVLATLIGAYEREHWQIDPPDPIEAVRYCMEQGGYTQSDLARLLGSRSRASEILKRHRPLTMEMAWKLHREWNIPAESLIRPYHVDESKERG